MDRSAAGAELFQALTELLVDWSSLGAEGALNPPAPILFQAPGSALSYILLTCLLPADVRTIHQISQLSLLVDSGSHFSLVFAVVIVRTVTLKFVV